MDWLVVRDFSAEVSSRIQGKEVRSDTNHRVNYIKNNFN
jgi:hypothetical protein